MRYRDIVVGETYEIAESDNDYGHCFEVGTRVTVTGKGYDVHVNPTTGKRTVMQDVEVEDVEVEQTVRPRDLRTLGGE